MSLFVNKAVLVVDMPESCSECSLVTGYYLPTCKITCRALKKKSMRSDSREEDCPLKPLPEPKLVWYDDSSSDFERGFNSCLEEIMETNNVQERKNESRI